VGVRWIGIGQSSSAQCVVSQKSTLGYPQPSKGDLDLARYRWREEHVIGAVESASVQQTKISWRLPPQLAVVGAPSVCASKASSIFSAVTLPWGAS
jgi:hypothetical protein